MFEVKIEIPGLEELASAINNLAGAKAVEGPKKATTKKVTKEETKQEESVEEVPFEKEPKPAGTEASGYTLEQVRAKMTELCRAGKQKEVKAILTALGAADLKNLDASKYDEAMEKAGAL